MSRFTFPLALLVALVVFHYGAAEINLVLTQTVVKSYQHMPGICYQPPYPCGNITEYFGALGASQQWFDVPEPPHFKNPGAPEVRNGKPPVDYHLCNYTTHDHHWVTFPWGDQLVYLNIFNGMHFVNCLYGMCDEQVFFGGFKYGCVAVWRTRTFLALWYRKSETVQSNTRCFGHWCFVNVKITYPESCKCAQVYQCESPWKK